MNIQAIEGLGYKILITEYITKDVQRRTHKKKRINKKWLKRYGMKIVPDNTKILLVNNTLLTLTPFIFVYSIFPITSLLQFQIHSL